MNAADSRLKSVRSQFKEMQAFNDTVGGLRFFGLLLGAAFTLGGVYGIRDGSWQIVGLLAGPALLYFTVLPLIATRRVKAQVVEVRTKAETVKQGTASTHEDERRATERGVVKRFSLRARAGPFDARFQLPHQMHPRFARKSNSGLSVPPRYSQVERPESEMLRRVHRETPGPSPGWRSRALQTSVHSEHILDHRSQGTAEVFSIWLLAAGRNKIAAIRTVREVTDLGLPEAKEMVVGVPSLVLNGLSKQQADKVRTKFQEDGSSAEVRPL